MYDNTNSGALFKNDRKESDKHPDYKGSLNVAGTEYWVSGWIREAGPMAKNPGSKFMSLSVQPKKVDTGGYSASSTVEDDDIPF